MNSESGSREKVSSPEHGRLDLFKVNHLWLMRHTMRYILFRILLENAYKLKGLGNKKTSFVLISEVLPNTLPNTSF